MYIEKINRDPRRREEVLKQRFLIPVLEPPCSAYFVCISYPVRRLFYSNVCALQSGHHRIFHHDSSSKRVYMFHSKGIKVCKLYLFTEVYDVTLVCVWRPCKQRRSANPWMNVPKLIKLQWISPAQGVGSNEHCIGIISIGTQFMHVALF